MNFNNPTPNGEGAIPARMDALDSFTRKQELPHEIATERSEAQGFAFHLN
jgi:hypothetical protein